MKYRFPFLWIETSDDLKIVGNITFYTEKWIRKFRGDARIETQSYKRKDGTL